MLNIYTILILKTNNLHTMLFIKKELNEPLLCLFSDVIFDIKILEKLKKRKRYCISNR